MVEHNPPKPQVADLSDIPYGLRAIRYALKVRGGDNQWIDPLIEQLERDLANGPRAWAYAHRTVYHYKDHIVPEKKKPILRVIDHITGHEPRRRIERTNRFKIYMEDIEEILDAQPTPISSRIKADFVATIRRDILHKYTNKRGIDNGTPYVLSTLSHYSDPEYKIDPETLEQVRDVLKRKIGIKLPGNSPSASGYSK